MRAHVSTSATLAEQRALLAVMDQDEDVARDALSELLPDDLSALALAARRLSELADCAARGRRNR